jgi:hypothetical protein
MMLKWGFDQAAAERVPVVVELREQPGFWVFEQLELGFNPG